jgi:hypothetical protein
MVFKVFLIKLFKTIIMEETCWSTTGKNSPYVGKLYGKLNFKQEVG